MTLFTAILVVPWLFALALTPVIERWATAHGWLDIPDERKAHARPIPLLGGVAVFGAMVLGIAIVALLAPPLRAGLVGAGSLGALGIGIGAMLVLGALDDRKNLRPRTKLLWQIAIASTTWWLGFRCGPLELPFGLEISEAAIPSFAMTVLWILLVTNAFNLIDGLDGLAAGLGILATLTIFVLANENGATVPVIGSLALAGALAGFLRFNTPPARIFLGDAGSTAIGYTIAVLALGSYQKSPTAVVLVVPFILLGVPLLDTLVAVLRRLAAHLRREGREGLGPFRIGRALATADRGHVHHLLLRMGWSVRGTLFILYAISALLALIGLWMRTTSPATRWFVWLLLVGMGVLGLRRVQTRVELRERLAVAPDRQPEQRCRAS